VSSWELTYFSVTKFHYNKLISEVPKISLYWYSTVYIYIYIIFHHSLREHRALTKFRHLAQLLASTLTSFHLLPWCLISSKIGLRHVVRGLPRDLVPWGFHSKAAIAMSPGGRRSVWPSHSHLPCRISSSIGFCLALTHSSWFDIWTGQNIFSILQMHLLTRTCSWCMMVLVSFQVSQPYLKNYTRK